MGEPIIIIRQDSPLTIEVLDLDIQAGTKKKVATLVLENSGCTLGKNKKAKSEKLKNGTGYEIEFVAVD